LRITSLEQGHKNGRNNWLISLSQSLNIKVKRVSFKIFKIYDNLTFGQEKQPISIGCFVLVQIASSSEAKCQLFLELGFFIFFPHDS